MFDGVSDCSGSWTTTGDWPITTLQSGNNRTGPRGIAVEPDVAGSAADIYVLHDQNKQISKFDVNGTEYAGWNMGTANDGPLFITIDKYGYLYVMHSSGLIEKCNLDSKSCNIADVDLSAYIEYGGETETGIFTRPTAAISKHRLHPITTRFTSWAVMLNTTRRTAG